MSDFLHFTEHTLQEAAILTMIIVYSLRLRWLFKFKKGGERQAATGSPYTSRRKGIIYSWANIFMPWAMESSRNKLFFYLQFSLFHIGVTMAITLSFIIPYAPSLLTTYSWIVPLFQVFIGLACIIGFGRLIRRMFNQYLRAISSPDDYFAIILLTVWFGFAFFAVPNNISGGEGLMATYFIMTAFFLIYVPFSKISHYLYYPFTRYWLGKTMGHRGVFPLKQGVKGGGI
jgi:nitrate reductase gamma subunit